MIGNLKFYSVQNKIATKRLDMEADNNESK